MRWQPVRRDLITSRKQRHEYGSGDNQGSLSVSCSSTRNTADSHRNSSSSATSIHSHRRWSSAPRQLGERRLASLVLCLSLVLSVLLLRPPPFAASQSLSPLPPPSSAPALSSLMPTAPAPHLPPTSTSPPPAVD